MFSAEFLKKERLQRVLHHFVSVRGVWLDFKFKPQSLECVQSGGALALGFQQAALYLPAALCPLWIEGGEGIGAMWVGMQWGHVLGRIGLEISVVCFNSPFQDGRGVSCGALGLG